jgi:hypothetical protein
MRRALCVRLVLAVGCACCLLLPEHAGAQTCGVQGNPAVYGTCSGSTALVASTAYLDASAFYPADGDICQTINTVLTTYVPYAGAVVDARGILPTSGDTLQCSINPFSGVAVPSTVLLPAANIQIKDTWVLPSNTRIVGGDPLPATTYATLQVQSIGKSKSRARRGPGIVSGSSSWRLIEREIQVVPSAPTSDCFESSGS